MIVGDGGFEFVEFGLGEQRAGGIQFDGRRDEQQQRRDQRQDKQGQNDIA